MSFFFRWPWSRRRAVPALAHLRVVLYTRQGCHLCAVAWETLRRQQRRYHFPLAVVDVDTDPELTARHGSLVPVVTVDGKIRFRGGVNPVLLARLLYAEGVRRRGQGDRSGQGFPEP